MDFDIGNLIYIVLTIVFIVLGTMGKKKKGVPANAETSDSEPDSELSSSPDTEQKIRDFLSSFNGDDQSAEQESFMKETRGSNPGKIDNLNTLLTNSQKEKRESDLYKIEDHINDIMNQSNMVMDTHKKGKASFVNDSMKDFSPRKAWLFYEVFKPKYF